MSENFVEYIRFKRLILFFTYSFVKHLTVFVHDCYFINLELKEYWKDLMFYYTVNHNTEVLKLKLKKNAFTHSINYLFGSRVFEYKIFNFCSSYSDEKCWSPIVIPTNLWNHFLKNNEYTLPGCFHFTKCFTGKIVF